MPRRKEECVLIRKQDIINSNSHWRVMAMLLKMNFKEPFNLTELANRLKVSTGHRVLNEVKTFLVQEKIFEIVKDNNREKYYKLHSLALAKMLREATDFDYAGDIIEKTVYAYNY